MRNKRTELLRGSNRAPNCCLGGQQKYARQKLCFAFNLSFPREIDTKQFETANFSCCLCIFGYDTTAKQEAASVFIPTVSPHRFPVQTLIITWGHWFWNHKKLFLTSTKSVCVFESQNLEYWDGEYFILSSKGPTAAAAQTQNQRKHAKAFAQETNQ